MTDAQEKLLAEKIVIKKGLADPAVQLVLSKLMDAADKLPAKMIRAYDERERNRIQALYEAFHDEIPRLLEVAMNADFDASQNKPKWGFWSWLKNTTVRINRTERT